MQWFLVIVSQIATCQLANIISLVTYNTNAWSDLPLPTALLYRLSNCRLTIIGGLESKFPVTDSADFAAMLIN